MVNILIAGVGGQGSLKLGQIIGSAAAKEGKQVTVSDTFTSSQRGGSVLTHVRINELSPLIPEGEGDLFLGLEPMETLRNLRFMKQSGKVILNDQAVLPLVKTKEEYPSVNKIINKIKEYCEDTVEVAADNSKSMNIFMLGCLASKLPIKIETLKEVISEMFSSNQESNLKAFDLGCKN